jgi:hypothetical protein
MFKMFTKTTLAMTVAAFAFAQTPQTSQSNTQNNTNTNSAQSTNQTTASSMTTGGGQSFRGVLMDASCAAIQSTATQSTSIGSSLSPDATRNRTDAPSSAGSTGSSTQNQSLSAGNSSGIGGSTSNASSAAAAPGSSANTTNTGGTAATRNTTAEQSGANNSHEGQATAHAGTIPPTDARSTATASAAGTTAGSSTLSTYNGASGSGSAADGERNRSAAGAEATGAGSQWTTVREKYRECMVTPSTSSFALMSNGQLYLIDDSSGALRQRTSSNTAGAANDFRTITVMGTPKGGRLSITSVQ